LTAERFPGILLPSRVDFENGYFYNLRSFLEVRVYNSRLLMARNWNIKCEILDSLLGIGLVSSILKVLQYGHWLLMDRVEHSHYDGIK
jgi:hypothetical protein